MDEDQFFKYTNPLFWIVLVVLFIYYSLEKICSWIKNIIFLVFKIDDLSEDETDVLLKIYHKRMVNGVSDKYNWWAKWTWSRGIDTCIKNKLKDKK